jgi:hypothetical protein
MMNNDGGADQLTRMADMPYKITLLFISLQISCELTGKHNRNGGKRGTQSAESVSPMRNGDGGEGVIPTLYVLQLLLS